MQKTYILIVLLVGVVTVAGLFAPLWPYADVFNHFRPWILIASMLTFLAAVTLKFAKVSKLLLTCCVANLILFLTPLLANPASMATSQSEEIKLLSFNFLSKNKQLSKLIEFLEREDADIVLLQEFPIKYKRRLFAEVSSQYRYTHTCDCRGQVLLSKRKWLEAGAQSPDEKKPPLIWASFRSVAGTKYRVIGLHPYFPLKQQLHVPNYRWLIENFQKFEEPVILAGDFNATPWSWMLQRLSWVSGLRRGGTFTFSWPGHWSYQFLLIDNVFVSPSLEVTQFDVGPDLGSDHRPIVAKIALP